MAAKDGASNCYHIIAALAEEVRQAGGQSDRGGGGFESGRAHLIEDERVCIMALDLRNTCNCLSWRAIWRFFKRYYLLQDRPAGGVTGLYKVC